MKSAVKLMFLFSVMAVTCGMTSFAEAASRSCESLFNDPSRIMQQQVLQAQLGAPTSVPEPHLVSFRAQSAWTWEYFRGVIVGVSKINDVEYLIVRTGPQVSDTTAVQLNRIDYTSVVVVKAVALSPIVEEAR